MSNTELKQLQEVLHYVNHKSVLMELNCFANIIKIRNELSDYEEKCINAMDEIMKNLINSEILWIDEYLIDGHIIIIPIFNKLNASKSTLIKTDSNIPIFINVSKQLNEECDYKTELPANDKSKQVNELDNEQLRVSNILNRIQLMLDLKETIKQITKYIDECQYLNAPKETNPILHQSNNKLKELYEIGYDLLNEAEQHLIIVIQRLSTAEEQSLLLELLNQPKNSVLHHIKMIEGYLHLVFVTITEYENELKTVFDNNSSLYLVYLLNQKSGYILTIIISITKH